MGLLQSSAPIHKMVTFGLSDGVDYHMNARIQGRCIILSGSDWLGNLHPALPSHVPSWNTLDPLVLSDEDAQVWG